MKVIASMMTSMRALLIPGFRDVIGVNAAVVARIKSGECDHLLCSATESGITGIVNYLVDAGVDKEVKKIKDGWTPLHVAAKKGHTDIVKLLLDAEVDMNVKDNGGWTPLNLAAKKGHTDIVSLLTVVNSTPTLI